MAVFVHRWNHDCAVARGLTPEHYAGFYQHETIHDMQLVSDTYDEDQVHGNLPNPSDYASTGETCYTPIVKHCKELLDGGKVQGEESESVLIVERQMSRGMEFMAERDGLAGIPVTRVTPAEEPLFSELIPQYRRAQSNNDNHQHGACDFASMSNEWDIRAEEEWSKPVGSRKKIYRKTPQILKAHYKSHQRKDYERRTQCQLATIIDPDTGVESTTTVRRGVEIIRQRLHETARSLPIRPPRADPLTRQEPRAAAPGQNEQVLLPPREIARAHANQDVMSSIQSRHHLRLPAPLGRQQKLGRAACRCYRCGWERKGDCHDCSSSPNSVEYCKVPATEIYPNWEAPEGYNIGDEPRTVSTRPMKAIWKRICEQHKIPKDARFPGWH
jgi:hypothetical protein